MNQRFTQSMRKLIPCLSLLLASTAVAADAEEASQQLLDLEGQIAAAVVNNDTKFVERVWGDDFIYTGVRGEIKGKQEILAELKSGKLKFTEMKFDEQRVRVYGATAIVTGRATTKGESPQGAIRGTFRYTRFYVLRDGQWRLVAFQGTPIQESSPAPTEP
jgi:uncharacterized protein (TIGR02246 family)